MGVGEESMASLIASSARVEGYLVGGHAGTVQHAAEHWLGGSGGGWKVWDVEGKIYIIGAR